MIIWLASYPRSGNTFFRILLKQLYGIRTPTSYVGADFTAFEVGKELVGHVADEWTVEEMAARSEVLIVKTHRRAQDVYPAVYLYRDGRDSLVSYARKKSEGMPEGYENVLRDLIVSSSSSTGTWGQNVLHWLRRSAGNTVFVSYEALVRDPELVVGDVLRELGVDVSRLEGALPVKSFAELQVVNGDFFRRGIVGSYKDEMPDELHDLFWGQAENSEAMRLLGYDR